MAEVDIKSLVSRLDESCTRALNHGAGLCVSRGNYEVTVEHYLHALTEDPYGDIDAILNHYGCDKGRVQRAIAGTLDELKAGNSGRPVFSPILVSWVKETWLQSSLTLGHERIRSGVLLRTLLQNFGRFGGGDYLDVFEAISVADLDSQYDEITHASAETESANAEGGGSVAGADDRGDDSALSKFTIDFTARAREGHIDPIFGRDREIRQMVDVLARRRKNNPIVVGEAGVGKTALIEGLALRIASGDVPDIIADVDILSLDMGLLQAGASVKGEFENRLRGVIEEVKSSPKPIIMFIDEAHTLIGAGGAAGQGDAANLLKPALARGELRTIAATTWSEYKKYFEKDPALARRFQPIKVEEPSDEVATTMLRGLREKYEESHGVFVRDDAVAAAAEMGSRYIAGRQHPDKGVDLLDTASARVKISLTTKPGVLEDLQRSVQTDERELGAHMRDKDNGAVDRDERIGELEDAITKTKTDVEEMTSRWEAERAAAEAMVTARKALEEARKDDAEVDTSELETALEQAAAALAQSRGDEPLVHAEVTPEVVSQVIADWTGIPLGNMVNDEAKTLLEFEDLMIRRVKGQDHVMEAVGEGIRSAKAGLTDPGTPHGVFLFVGPSGVGKTETATGVADLLYGGERFMTVVNMSEFQEKHSISRLIGSPPGYVGYGEGGMLTEAVRQRPYSVVLLDEVEKADPEVLNLFYQVFDKGDLNDGEGRTIDFANTVIFLTSNLATDIITEAGLRENPPSIEDLVDMIRPTLSAHFKPALLARMKIVPFFPLAGEVMKDITRLKLGKVQKRLQASHRMDFEFDDAVVDAIAARCTEVETGARNVDHIINGTLLPGISREILTRMGDAAMPELLTVTIGDAGDFSFAFDGETV